jgi:hypothetical protein
MMVAESAWWTTDGKEEGLALSPDEGNKERSNKGIRDGIIVGVAENH